MTPAQQVADTLSASQQLWLAIGTTLASLLIAGIGIWISDRRSKQAIETAAEKADTANRIAKEKADEANAIVKATADEANRIAKEANAKMDTANELSKRSYEQLLSQEQLLLEVSGFIVRTTFLNRTPGRCLHCEIVNKGRTVHIKHVEAIDDSTGAPIGIQPFCNRMTNLHRPTTSDLELKRGQSLTLCSAFMEPASDEFNAIRRATRVRVVTQQNETAFGPLALQEQVSFMQPLG